MKKNMTNDEIYSLAVGFYNDFNGDMKLPVKVGFYLIKNKNYFIKLGKEIDEKRAEIRSRCAQDQDRAYTELKELSEIRREVSFYQVDLKDFGDLNLSLRELEILEFMIKEEE